MAKATPRRLPVLLTDEAAERFIESADLSKYDLSGFRPMQFDFAPKDERRNVRHEQETTRVHRRSEPS
jgi:predicted DNA binding CopG/RHH family protein